MQRFNAAAYLRLSKEEFSNEKESNSITNQKLIIDNYLKEHKEYANDVKWQQLVAKLPWGHNLLLIEKINNYFIY